MPCLYALAGIAPPHIRRKVANNADRCLQEDGPRYPLQALPSTGVHPETALLTQRKHLTPQNKFVVPHCGQKSGTPLVNDQLSGVTERSS